MNNENPLREIIGTAKDVHLLECHHLVPYQQPKKAIRCAECSDGQEDVIEEGETIEDAEN